MKPEDLIGKVPWLSKGGSVDLAKYPIDSVLKQALDALAGLGQFEESTLQREEEQDRLDEFIESLRACKDSVEYLDLTLDSLLTRVILPDRDKPIFIRMMQEKLGLKSTTDRIAGYL